MVTKSSAGSTQEVDQLRSQVAALEQLLEVHERTTIEQSERLEHVLQDLREHARRLERSEERYSLATRATNDVIWDWDLVSNELLWNEALETTFGYSLEETPQEVNFWLDHVHPEDRERVSRSIHAVIDSGGTTWTDEYRFVRTDGRYATVLDRGFVARDEAGKATRMIGSMQDITEDRRAENALRDRERQFVALANSIPNLAWMADETGWIFWYNQRWYEYTGTTPKDMEGWGWQSVHDPDELPKVLEAWTSSIRTGELFDMVFPILGADGVFRSFLTRVVPVKDAEGRVVRWVGTNTDITERKEIEERQRLLVETGAMLASSLDYQATLASVARLAVPTLADWCAIDIVGEDGAVQRVEVAHPEPVKRHLASEIQRLYPPDPNAPSGVPQVLRTGKPEMVSEIPDEMLEMAARDPTHLRMIRELGLRSYMVVPMIARGRTLGAISLVSAESGRRYGPADLETARELALRSAFAVDNARLFTGLERLIGELNLQRTRLADLFQNAPAFIAVLQGPNHVFEIANPLYLQLVGDRSVIGRAVAEALPEVVEQGFIALLDGVRTSGEPFVGNELQVFLRRTPGATPEERFVNFVYQPVRDADRSVGGIFVHGVDVTEQVRARQQVEQKAEELARTARALEATNRELDQFAYVASHDLKAPLRGIANLSQWIEEDIAHALSDENRQQMKLLRGRVHRMEGLIEGILQYSRAGRMTGKSERIKTGELAREAAELLAPPANVAIRIAPDLPTLQTERLPLQQVLMNLIGNAIKYTHRPDARVEVVARDAGEFVEFGVADNGPGIAPEYHEKIFAIFQRLDARDQVEGTGIGLSLVKKIVEGRRGRVWVESREGHGTTFRFTWPKMPEKVVPS